MEAGVLAHATGAVMFAVLTVLLMTGWKGRLSGGVLIAAGTATALWAAALAVNSYLARPLAYPWIFALEAARDALWLAFLVHILWGHLHWRRSRWLLLAGSVLPLPLAIWLGHPGGLPLGAGAAPALWANALLLFAMALICLVLIEQVFRNTAPVERWAIKYLCIGLGGMFAYDLLLYAHAMTYRGIDPTLWEARGLVTALAAPLLAVAAARNPRWSTQIFVSRQIVFYSTTLLAVGAAAVLMAMGTLFIERYGGSWSRFAQVVFLFASVLLLLVLLTSKALRARLKVFLGKHFYSHRYDYREEWLGFVQSLSRGQDLGELPQRSIEAVGAIVDSPGGWLWLEEGGRYRCAGVWRRRLIEGLIEAADPVLEPAVKKGWVIELGQAAAACGSPGAALLREAWLLVPLPHRNRLLGFIALSPPLAPRRLDWEDWDLLRTVGRTAATYLALVRMSETLSEARQFDAFNRLAAFVVHDLKNILAQLELVVRNADRHGDNPAFVKDVFDTVAHAADKMGRLLEALRRGRSHGAEHIHVPLDRVVRRAVDSRQALEPRPSLEVVPADYPTCCDPDRLQSVIENLIENAQQATPAGGRVALKLARDGHTAVLSISDTGCGMDCEFLASRLFRPFETTKGNAGMGIGAYECREFVTALGGGVQVQSTPGMGTTFTITLPLERPMCSGPTVSRQATG